MTWKEAFARSNAKQASDSLHPSEVIQFVKDDRVTARKFESTHLVVLGKSAGDLMNDGSGAAHGAFVWQIKENRYVDTHLSS